MKRRNVLMMAAVATRGRPICTRLMPLLRMAVISLFLESAPMARMVPMRTAMGVIWVMISGVLQRKYERVLCIGTPARLKRPILSRKSMTR